MPAPTAKCSAAEKVPSPGPRTMLTLLLSEICRGNVELAVAVEVAQDGSVGRAADGVVVGILGEAAVMAVAQHHADAFVTFKCARRRYQVDIAVAVKVRRGRWDCWRLPRPARPSS